MSTKTRFTTYLSERERREISTAAASGGTSENFIVRLAIRAYFGLPSKPLGDFHDFQPAGGGTPNDTSKAPNDTQKAPKSDS